jgi:NADH-quinone oxidoreductase subunit N
MGTVNVPINWGLLTPEIAVCALALMVLALDLALPGRKAWLGVATTLGLGVVLAVTAGGFARDSASLFGGRWIVDPLAIAFKIVFLVSAMLVCLASVRLVPAIIHATGEYYALLVFSVLGMMTLASAGDLVSLYLGIELTTIPLYVLAASSKRDPRSAEAGLKYLLLGAVSSAVLLYGISLVYGIFGSTRFSDMALGTTIFAASGAAVPALIIGIIMMTAGFAFKAAAAPFHMWAPDVYHGAPTPVTAFLSAGSKAAGFALLVRVLAGPFGAAAWEWTPLILALSLLSIVVGNLAALQQTNIKRLLAYSGISHAGYLLLGLAAGGLGGISALLLYLFLYVFTNIGAFMVVTAVGAATGSDEISAYAGLSRRSPLLAFAMLICLLSLGGIPALAGFVGKWFIFLAAIDAGYYGMVTVAVLAAVMSLYYYLMVARQMYILDPADRTPIPVGGALAVGLVVAVVATIGIGVYFPPFLEFAQYAARSLF